SSTVSPVVVRVLTGRTSSKYNQRGAGSRNGSVKVRKSFVTIVLLSWPAAAVSASPPTCIAPAFWYTGHGCRLSDSDGNDVPRRVCKASTRKPRVFKKANGLKSLFLRQCGAFSGNKNVVFPPAGENLHTRLFRGIVLVASFLPTCFASVSHASW